MGIPTGAPDGSEAGVNASDMVEYLCMQVAQLTRQAAFEAAAKNGALRQLQEQTAELNRLRLHQPDAGLAPKLSMTPEVPVTSISGNETSAPS